MATHQKADALIERRTELHDSGDTLAAAPDYREAADLYEPCASFILVAADSYLEGGRFRDAAAAYRHVVAAHPDHDQAIAGLKRAEELAAEQTTKHADLSDLAPVAATTDGGGGFVKKLLRG